jgi:uncharacterized protein YkwD
MSVAKPIARAVVAAAALLIPTLPVAAADYEANASVMRVLELTNLEREKAGVGPLVLSAELTAAAQTYSQVMASGDCFAHTCGTTPNFTDRLVQAGYGDLTAAAENIGAGYRSPEAVVDGWMNSAGHRANLLSANYTEIGIGVASGGGYGIFWTQDFGARRFAPQPAPPDEAIASIDQASEPTASIDDPSADLQ